MQRATRMKRELEMLSHPPPGISCWPSEENEWSLEATIHGTEGTPYANGIFRLSILLPAGYPFEPPKVSFITSVYHPNIDSAGRICLDVLNMPPKGSWKPSLNISTILISIQQLLNDPNPDDPLIVEIAEEFKYKYESFAQHAREWTEKHAKSLKRKKEGKENGEPEEKIVSHS